MVAAGICHTDLGVKAAWPAEAGPLVLGHEGAGVVEAVGADVSDIRPGDHVLLSYRSCRSCDSCVAGHVSYCERFRELNAVGVRPDGTTTCAAATRRCTAASSGSRASPTHALAYASNTVKVDAGLDLTVAAPLGCGIQTGAGAVLNVLGPAAGSSFVVFGAGGVGLAGLMAADLGPEPARQCPHGGHRHRRRRDGDPGRRAVAARRRRQREGTRRERGLGAGSAARGRRVLRHPRLALDVGRLLRRARARGARRGTRRSTPAPARPIPSTRPSAGPTSGTDAWSTGR